MADVRHTCLWDTNAPNRIESDGRARRGCDARRRERAGLETTPERGTGLRPRLHVLGLLAVQQVHPRQQCVPGEREQYHVTERRQYADALVRRDSADGYRHSPGPAHSNRGDDQELHGERTVHFSRHVQPRRLVR